MRDIIYSGVKTKIKYFVNSSKKKCSDSILISRNKKRDSFIAGNNNLYFEDNNTTPNSEEGFFVDSLNYRIARNYQNIIGNEKSFLLEKYYSLIARISETRKVVSYEEQMFPEKVSLIRLWNFSILTAIVIGMVSMSFIYRYFGQSVSAGDGDTLSKKNNIEILENKKTNNDRKVGKNYDEKVLKELKEKKDKINFEKKVKKMVKGYPIEKMLPYIFKQDKTTASFLIAIAKKESNWGKRVPVLNGQDCYNYWGYRQKRKRMGSGGHTCFNNRRDAVETVGRRLHTLQKKYNRTTPAKMIVWKCGNSCETHSKYSVEKWISDVSLYYNKLNK